MTHIPVLRKEVIKYLRPQAGHVTIDGTAGRCGHTEAILEESVPDGTVLAIDISEQQLAACAARLKNECDRVTFAEGSFADIAHIADRTGFTAVNGVLLDIGLSSWHLEESGRGFSFKREEPLIMTYEERERHDGPAACDIVNQWPREELERLLREHGEERFSARIADTVVERRADRPIETTTELAEIVKQAIPQRARGNRHPAVRTFQAIRIAVNGELEALERAIPAAFALLVPGGRLVIIAYHSLEDRIVKRAFQRFSEQGSGKRVTKKPVTPTDKEINTNSRARSAKLRAVEKR